MSLPVLIHGITHREITSREKRMRIKHRQHREHFAHTTFVDSQLPSVVAVREERRRVSRIRASQRSFEDCGLRKRVRAPQRPKEYQLTCD